MDTELLEQRRQLESGFAYENWSRLSFDQRLELCRELENNYAAECGVSPCYVTATYMDGGTYGYQFNHTIVLNSHVLGEGNFHVILRDENKQPILDANGQTVKRIVPIPTANWLMMETVYHEGTHGVQESESRLAYTYINGDHDYALYRLQGCEKEAFSTGRTKTLEAIRVYENSGEPYDVTAERYINSVSKDSFQKYLDDAAKRYHDPEIEQTLNQFISDRDNGVVPDHPSASYQAIEREYNKQHLFVQNTGNSVLFDNNSTGMRATITAEIGAETINENAGDNTGNTFIKGDTESYNKLGSEVNGSYGTDDSDANVSNETVSALYAGNGVDDGYGVYSSAVDSGIETDIGIDDGYGVDNVDVYGNTELGSDGYDNYRVNNSDTGVGTSASSGTSISGGPTLE